MLNGGGAGRVLRGLAAAQAMVPRPVRRAAALSWRFAIVFLVAAIAGLQLSQTLLEREAIEAERVAWQRGVIGPARHLADALRPLDPAQRRAALPGLTRHYAWPVSILPTAAVATTTERARELAAGRMIDDMPRTVFYVALDATEVLQLGPISVALTLSTAQERRLFALQMAVMIGCFVLAGVVSAVWLARLQRGFAGVLRAFGAGQYDARAPASGAAGAAALVESFNAMADQVQRAIEQQRTLLQDVSHELRTPLARMAFSIEMLRGHLDAPGLARVAQLEADLAELDGFVNELLTHARLERGQAAAESVMVSLDEWVPAAVARQMPPQCPIAPACAVDAPGPVLLPLRWAERALGNLVRNAARHARQRIAVTAVHAGGVLRLVVEDDGPGIPAAERERVFRPFVRLDASRDRKTGGHGLGLAIVQRIAALHGGAVRVEDSPLGGARFVFTMRVAPATDAGGARRVQTDTKPAQEGDRPGRAG